MSPLPKMIFVAVLILRRWLLTELNGVVFASCRGGEASLISVVIDLFSSLFCIYFSFAPCLGNIVRFLIVLGCASCGGTVFVVQRYGS